MDLHDGVIQSIYAIGLMLDDSRHRLADDPQGARATLDSAINGLNRVITDIRSYIHDLRTHQFQGRNLQQGLEEMVRDLQTYSILNIDMDIDPGALARISPPATQDMLQIAREALSNIRKHAHATQIRIRLARTPDGITFTIADNGVGLPADAYNNGGHGLHNMCERATHLNGHLQLHTLPSGGTQVELTLPT
jgi:signal transduction histidine kinase